jgi:amidase
MRQSHRRSTRLLSEISLLSLAGLLFAGSAVAAEVRYDPGDKVYFTYCYAHPPAARINPGDSVVTSTRDASNDAFSVTDKTLAPKIDLTKVNPQTGPFYVEGAEPGDTLEVHIDSIELNRDWGWGGSIPYFGELSC